MKIYISADIEGVSGICHPDEVMPGRPDYDYGRKLMANDINAAIEGALEGGATDILVSDSHDGMRNLRLADLKLHPAARLIAGVTRQNEMVEGLDGTFDAALFIGYHAKANNKSGILSHTYAPKQFYQVEINGNEVGESQINAAVAGYYGVPAAMFSGDQELEEEVRSFLGDVPIAMVKRAIDRFSAEFLSPEESYKRIKETAARSLKELSKRQVFTFEPPITMNITMCTPTQAYMVATIPGTRRIKGTGVTFTHNDFCEVYHFMVAAMLIGMFCTDKDY